MNTYPPITTATSISDASMHQRKVNEPQKQGVDYLTTDDPCWADEPTFLIKPARLIEFFPVSNQTLAERVNAVTRLVAYIGISVSVLERKSSSLQVAILVMALIAFLWKISLKQKPARTLDDAYESFDVLPETCTEPSAGNPYMNVLPGDPATRGPACVGPQTDKMVENYFQEGLYSDVTENVFIKPGNPRTFLTQPVTQVMPDRDKLTDWLYKDGNINNMDGKRATREIYSDQRRQRQILPSDIAYAEQFEGYPPL